MAKTKTKSGTRFNRTFECKFANVGIGHDKARIGVAIADADPDLADLRQTFVGAQLACELSVDPNAKGDVAGQDKLLDADELLLEGVADSMRLGVYSDRAVVSLQFSKAGIDVGLLSRFSSLKGKLRVKRLAAAAAVAESNGDGEEDGAE